MTHPDLVVTRTQAPHKERTLYCIGGVAPQVNLRVNNPDIGTLETALCTRMYTCEVEGRFVEPPLPSADMVKLRLSDFKSRLCTFSSTPEDHESVVAQYDGPKRKVYERACASLSIKPVGPADAVSVAFVKPEKVGPTKAPRCIQPRDPRYNLELGRYIKHIEHRLYKRIATVFGDGPTVMKGYNVQEIGRIAAGKWNSFVDPVAVGLDATKFDMHVSPAMLAWEHSIYLSIFKGDRHLRRLLTWQMNNVGRGYCGDGKLKYKVTGKRFSGDMNTALGNCIIMCGMVHAYLQHVGVRGKLMNNGDDCVVFMEREDLGRFTVGLDKWFLEMGFRMVAEDPVFDLQKVEFCQMRPLRTANGWCMVRNVPTALAKDSLCLLPIRNQTELNEWMGAIGACGMALTDGVPIMQAFYKRLRHLGSNKSRWKEMLLRNAGMRFLMQGNMLREEHVTAEARYDCWLAWGILPDHQVALEEEYAQMSVAFSSDSASSYEFVPFKQL